MIRMGMQGAKGARTTMELRETIEEDLVKKKQGAHRRS